MTSRESRLRSRININQRLRVGGGRIIVWFWRLFCNGNLYPIRMVPVPLQLNGMALSVAIIERQFTKSPGPEPGSSSKLIQLRADGKKENSLHLASTEVFFYPVAESGTLECTRRQEVRSTLSPGEID